MDRDQSAWASAPCVVCADVGSVKQGKFGWIALQLEASGTKAAPCGKGHEPSSMSECVARKLAEGHPVALGFECPLWIPLAWEEKDLTRGRPDDGNRAWSASGGATVLASSLPITTWSLRAIASALSRLGREHRDIDVTLDFDAFRRDPKGLLLWEAFVSGADKDRESVNRTERSMHIDDARIGARTFIQRWRGHGSPSRVPAEPDEVLSLIGMALLRSGWRDDPALLSQPVEIVRPQRARV